MEQCDQVLTMWYCGPYYSQCYEVKQCIYGYYQAVLHFCKKEYNDGTPWSRMPEGAQNSIPKSFILEATTPASTHHRSSWTGQMNFSYSLISNSFNSMIIVLYLFCAIPTVADIWKIVILLKFEIIIASYVMHNVYCDKFKFFEIIAFREFSIHWCLQFRI